jgi:hypothetical protein
MLLRVTILPEIAGRIRAAVATETFSLLNKLWTEIEDIWHSFTIKPTQMFLVLSPCPLVHEINCIYSMCPLCARSRVYIGAELLIADVDFVA